MRLSLHIFKKDARRLWWEIAVTLGVLAMLVHFDSTRNDFIPGPMEALLNLLVPAAWSYLIAMLIHQEALVGDRQFWITRPYPRFALLGAKLLFLLAFIHLPSFLADVIIVAARGFQPLHFLPSLVGKQVLIGCVLTLPVTALATVTRNLAQFVLAGIVLAAGAGLLANNFEQYYPWISVDTVRRNIAVGVIAAAAAAIVLLQYARMRTVLSRTLGIAAVVASALIFVYTPREYTVGFSCAAAGTDSPVSIGLAKGRELPPAASRRQWPQTSAQFLIPINTSGIPEGRRVALDQLRFSIIGPDGERWAMSSRARTGRPPTDLVGAWFWIMENSEAWQWITIERRTYGRIGIRTVHISGKAAVALYREGEQVIMPLGPDASAVPGLGRCSSAITQHPNRPEMLKVICESPSRLPFRTGVTLVDTQTGTAWNQILGDSMPHLPYPTRTWLSPIQRRQTFFHLVEGRPQGEGSKWLAPRGVLPSARVAFVPEEMTGCFVVSYAFKDLRLSEFTIGPESITIRQRP